LEAVCHTARLSYRAGTSPALVVAIEPNDDTGPLFAIVAL